MRPSSDSALLRPAWLAVGWLQAPLVRMAEHKSVVEAAPPFEPAAASKSAVVAGEYMDPAETDTGCVCNRSPFYDCCYRAAAPAACYRRIDRSGRTTSKSDRDRWMTDWGRRSSCCSRCLLATGCHNRCYDSHPIHLPAHCSTCHRWDHHSVACRRSSEYRKPGRRRRENHQSC